MKVIVLGNGIHTKKRIVPALNKIEIIDSLTIADRRVVEDIKLSKYFNSIRIPGTGYGRFSNGCKYL